MSDNKDIVEVEYKVYTTYLAIREQLDKLAQHKVLSFDTEVRSKYTKAQRKETKELIKDYSDKLELEDRLFCKLVANSSGLSHPKITEVTHWIFSADIHNSIIFITVSERTRKFVADWCIEYQGKLVMHNAGFDMKILHYLTDKFPSDYEDTQLLVKSYINHTETWKANTSLKELMAEYYPSSWVMYDEYDVDNLKDKDFLIYMAYDTSATLLLWNNLQEHKQMLLEER